MEELVNCLRVVDASTLPDGNDTVLLQDHDHGCVEMARILAADILFEEDGTPRYSQMDSLYRVFGYFVIPGPQTQGRIRTKKGLICVG